MLGSILRWYFIIGVNPSTPSRVGDCGRQEYKFEPNIHFLKTIFYSHSLTQLLCTLVCFLALSLLKIVAIFTSIVTS